MRLIAIIVGCALSATLALSLVRDGGVWYCLAAGGVDADSRAVDESQSQTLERIQINNSQIELLLTGRATLEEIAVLLLEVNRGRPGFLTCIRGSHTELTNDAETIIHYIFAKVAERLSTEPRLRSEVVPRLEAELRAMFSAHGLGPQLNEDRMRMSVRKLGFIVASTRLEDRGRDEAAEADKTCALELPRWRLTVGGTALGAPKESALRWTNPAAGRVYGNTYVWLHEGRPAAAGCMYRYFDPFHSFNGELTALAGTGLVAKRDDEVLWKPRDTWTWKTIPGAAPPAANPVQRLRQMKEMADDFVVEVLDTRNVPRGEDQTPRLLPKPLYRYDAEKTKTVDGALFAFVVGTDPELLLLIECDTVAAKPEWRFGIGRMNRDAIRVKHRGVKVWEVAALKDNSSEAAYRFLDLGLRRESKP